MDAVLTVDENIQSALNYILRRLIEHYDPEQIVLYGSLVYGDPHADSDIDLLIVKETDETPLERRIHVRRLAAQPGRRIPFSPLVLTPDELAQRVALEDPFYTEILRQGILLYGRN